MLIARTRRRYVGNKKGTRTIPFCTVSAAAAEVVVVVVAAAVVFIVVVASLIE